MLRLTLSTLALAAGLLTTGAPAMAQAIDTAAIETATGLKGSYNRAEKRLQGQQATRRREDQCRSLDHATVHGAHLLGRVHANGLVHHDDGRYGAVRG